MNELRNILKDAGSVFISGHIRPDGDSCGACLAVYHYIKNLYPDKYVKAYLETLPERFEFMDSNREIIINEVPDEKFDLFIAVDSGSVDRLGDAQKIFYDAKMTVCIDHHISNKNYAGYNFVKSDASSTCEVLYELMDYEDIDFKTAEALYVGIMFDSGVFRYSNTSQKTMEAAGALMAKKIPFWDYIDECFLKRTYTQTQLLGRTLLTSMLLMDGKCIVATITKRMMEFYGAQTEDIEGIIEQLRVTKGVEVAILLHETGEQEYKVSLRSNDYVDVSKIAEYYGGGGHVKAAGFTMRGSVHDVVNNITKHIEIEV